MKRILVTGGAGYIGSHIILELLNSKYEVVVIDNLSTGDRLNIPNDVFFINGSILDIDTLKKAMSQNIDGVIHLAALKSASDSMKNPNLYTELNINGSLMILNEMLNYKIKNIIFSSTAAIYGKPAYLPIDENHPKKPINFYGFSKLSIEYYLKWYSKLKNINYVSLRYFNAAGYDSKSRIVGLEKNPANLLPVIMNSLINGESLKIYGNDYPTKDGTCIRDYIHVTDLADAHIKSINYLTFKNSPLEINLATGNGYSVKEIVDKTIKISSSRLNYEFVNRRDGDPAELIASSKLASKILNWNPEFSSLDNIISTMLSAYNV
tara:strand:+ start:35 stop:1000 length:966 start_codon:yes stop_codon:yes gene_type:complete